MKNNSQPDDKTIVLDIGGTHFRIGLYCQSENRLSDLSRFETPNFLQYSAWPVERLADKLVETIVDSIRQYLEQAQSRITKIGISFAGPVTADGHISHAPTIFGSKQCNLPLLALLQEKHFPALKVAVINDISAAAWRYSRCFDQPFCVITISSGVGNKVFFNNKVLINARGLGGEIGHYRYDFSEDALQCDCGGKGHVGAIASGRGVLAMAKKQAQAEPQAFKNSLLAELCCQLPAELTTYDIVNALQQRDEFTIKILKKSQSALAQVISCLYNAIGVEKYIIIGGFAQAIGQFYLDCLNDELIKYSFFGLPENKRRDLIESGENDDHHSLIGMGIYMADGRGEHET